MRTDRHALRAALWAQLALLRARWGLRHRGIERVVLNRPPEGLPLSAGRGVYALLRRRPHTCLERALVLQAWESAHGNVSDVVIGEQAQLMAAFWRSRGGDASGPRAADRQLVCRALSSCCK